MKTPKQSSEGIGNACLCQDAHIITIHAGNQDRVKTRCFKSLKGSLDKIKQL